MIKTITEEKVDIESDLESQLLLHNDDHNSFEHVEDCLIKVCKHTSEQAQQCALIVHLKGKCSVMHGPMEDLVSSANKLKSLGLSVEIV